MLKVLPLPAHSYRFLSLYPSREVSSWMSSTQSRSVSSFPAPDFSLNLSPFRHASPRRQVHVLSWHSNVSLQIFAKRAVYHEWYPSLALSQSDRCRPHPPERPRHDQVHRRCSHHPRHGKSTHRSLCRSPGESYLHRDANSANNTAIAFELDPTSNRHRLHR